MNISKNRYFEANWPALIVIVSISLFFPLAAYYFKYTDKISDKKVVNFPVEKNGWRLIDTTSNLLNSNLVGADEVFHALYVKEKTIINHYIAGYYKQSQGKELVGEQNSIYDLKIWKILSFDQYNLLLPQYCNVQINELVVSSRKNRSRLIWFQYNVAGVYTYSKYLAKVLAGWDILYAKKGSHIEILSVEIDNDLNSARDAIKRYITEAQITGDFCSLQVP